MLSNNYGYPTALQIEGYTLDPNTEKVKSIPAAENIPFGRVVCVVDPGQDVCQLPGSNKLAFSANLVAANTIDGSITMTTINSDNVSITTTTPIPQVTFATSHLNTMNLLIAAIQTISPSLTATLDTTDTNNRTIYVTSSDGSVVQLSALVVGAGASQATVSYNFQGFLKGIAVWTNRQPDTYGVSQYVATDVVGVITQGRVIVKPIDATDAYSNVYVQIIATNDAARGTIRNSADSGRAIPFVNPKFQDKALALGFNTLEPNLP